MRAIVSVALHVMWSLNGIPDADTSPRQHGYWIRPWVSTGLSMILSMVLPRPTLLLPFNLLVIAFINPAGGKAIVTNDPE